MKFNRKKNAFTLVELIVATIVLIILSSIGFVGYKSQLSTIRDSNRISTLVAIKEGLEMYRTRDLLPFPEEYITIKFNGNIISRQGYVGSKILAIIEYSDLGKDPKDDIFYSYYLTENRTYFQLMGFLEEESNIKMTKINLLNITNAEGLDYSERFPTVYGNTLGILTGTGNSLNSPIQELITGSLDIATTNIEYISYFTDINNIAGTGSILGELKTVAEVGGKYCSGSGGVIVCESESL